MGFHPITLAQNRCILPLSLESLLAHQRSRGRMAYASGPVACDFKVERSDVSQHGKLATAQS